MVLRYHWSDFQGMPGEGGVLEAMRKEGVQPGNYNFPHAKSMAQWFVCAMLTGGMFGWLWPGV